MARYIWLCVEQHSDGSTRVHGDTGRRGFDDPHRPVICQYGGPRNHGDMCGWWQLVKPRSKSEAKRVAVQAVQGGEDVTEKEGT